MTSCVIVCCISRQYSVRIIVSGSTRSEKFLDAFEAGDSNSKHFAPLVVSLPPEKVRERSKGF